MAAPHHRRLVTSTAVAVVTAVGLSACAAPGHDGSDSSGAADHGSRRSTTQLEPGPSQRESREPREYPTTDPRDDALSTFALDIDTGSYTRFRDAVNQERRVAPGEVRTEEFVNYFEQDYPAPEDGLDVRIDAAALPFRTDHRIVRVGIRSADVDDESRSDADLVLVIDCSGSMREANKMEMTKAALRTLTASLRPTDRVAMVCYSTEAEVALEPTEASDREAVEDAIDDLRPNASTNAEAGLVLGYDLARSMRSEGRMSRVVLVSDGVANVGDTSPGGILERISTQARAGTNLISVGVGITTYDDHLLEQLADRGDGWHVYVDTAAEAERVFATGLTGSLVVTAREAKAQVEFDPARVRTYRLLGYENRDVADQDFRNDAVDGGEVFAGHATTALYDVEMREGSDRAPFVTATVRYLDEAGRSTERSREMGDSGTAPTLDRAAPRLQQDVVVALLADRLVRGPWTTWTTASDLRELASGLGSSLDDDPDVAELVSLVDRADV